MLLIYFLCYFCTFGASFLQFAFFCFLAVSCYKCTKHQFIHLLTAIWKNSHIDNSTNHKRWYFQQHIDRQSVWCGQYHLLWFLLFSMCKSLNVAVNKCINWCFVHLSTIIIAVWFSICVHTEKCGFRVRMFSDKRTHLNRELQVKYQVLIWFSVNIWLCLAVRFLWHYISS